MKRLMRKSLISRNEKTKNWNPKLDRKFSSTTDADVPAKSSFYSRIKAIYSDDVPKMEVKVEESVVEIVKDIPEVVEEGAETYSCTLMEEETVISQPARPVLSKREIFAVEEVVEIEIGRRNVPHKKLRIFDEKKMMDSFYFHKKRSNVVKALKAFDLLSLHHVPMHTHYDACVHLCFEHDRAIDALEFLGEMHQLGVQPKHSTLRAAYKHFEKKNNLQRFLSFFLEQMGPENTEDFNNLKDVIKILIKGGDIEPAIDFFFYSSKKQNAPDAVFFRCMVDSLVEIGTVEEVLLFIHTVKKQGVEIKAIVYNDFMNGFVSKWKLGYAQVLFREMLRSKIIPNSDTCRIMLSGFVKHDHLSEASAFLRNLQKVSYTPTYEDYEYYLKVLLDNGFVLPALFVFEKHLEHDEKLTQTAVDMMLYDGLLKELSLSAITSEFSDKRRYEGFEIDGKRIMESIRQTIHHKN